MPELLKNKESRPWMLFEKATIAVDMAVGEYSVIRGLAWFRLVADMRERYKVASPGVGAPRLLGAKGTHSPFWGDGA